MILRPDQTAVALRAADNEAAGRVDQVFGFVGQQFRRQNRFDDVFDHGVFQLFEPIDGSCWVDRTTVSMRFTFAGPLLS